MSLFPQDRIDQIINAILTRIGYTPDVRNLLFNNVNTNFKNLLPILPIPLVQITNDLNEMNEIPRLTDGTIPFQLWLDQAGRLLKPFLEWQIIQQSLDDLSRSTLKAPIPNSAPPNNQTIYNIVQEKIILRDDMVSYHFLEQGFAAGISVGLVEVSRYDNGNPTLLPGNEPAIYLGTGWLLSKNLVVTNHHVINARDENEADAKEADFILQGNNATIRFDFNTNNAAGTICRSALLEAYDKTLDYAIFRLGVAVDRHPLQLNIEPVIVNQQHPQAVNIIQHPMGKPKRVAIRNNHIFDSAYPQIRYFTDTDGGSSGSAVFNDNWEVIALHRASVYVSNIPYNGQTTAWINEGVQIKAVIDHLSANKPLIAQEISQQ